MLTLARRSLLSSAHDCSEGGLSVAIAESAIAGNIGAQVQLPGGCDSAASMFGEDPTRVVISFLPQQEELVRRACVDAGVTITKLGAVGGSSLRFVGGPSLEVTALAAAHAQALQSIVG